MAEPKRYNLYEQQENEVKDKIEYEVAVLPLQNYVSSVRKFVCRAWNSFKVEKNKVKDSVGKSVQLANNEVNSAMQSIGIKNTRTALGIAAVSTAAVTGMVLARKKSVAHRVAYPVFIGGVVWGTFYCSSAQNRTYIRSQIKSIQSGYIKNKKSK